jgi:hypothetical protein
MLTVSPLAIRLSTIRTKKRKPHKYVKLEGEKHCQLLVRDIIETLNK